MEFRFRVKGKQRRASRERVIETVQGLMPEGPAVWMVEVEGARYPVKQVFCETFGVGRRDVSTRDAARVLERLGFEVTKGAVIARRFPKEGETRAGTWPPLVRWDRQDRLAQVECLELPPIWLPWSCVEDWTDVIGTGEHSDEILLPPAKPGVYEVKVRGEAEPIYIGKTLNLRRRIMEALIEGSMLHTAGQKMRENENFADLSVRWAVTDRPAAAEEELWRRHVEFWGRPPKYSGGG